MQVTALALSQILNGTVDGNPDIIVNRPSKIEEGEEGTITFLANPKYEHFVYSTGASVVLVSKDFKPTQPISATLLRVDDVYASIAFLLEKFGEQQKPVATISDKSSIHPTAKIGSNTYVGDFTVADQGVVIGENCTIYPQVFLGKNVQIGNGVTLNPGVKIYHECIIGDNCILHANVVIGSDGFGFAPQEDGTFKKIAQIGNVLVENDVEIGANTVIDRATMGSTYIRAGAKIDNLVQIAHNVEIGRNTAIAAQAGIAGSTKIGRNVMIGGQSGFVGHITIADGTKIQAQSGVNASVTQANAALYGSPALAYNEYLRAYSIFRRLPELSRQVNELQKKLNGLVKDSSDQAG